MKKISDFKENKIDIPTVGKLLTGGVERFVQTSNEIITSSGCTEKMEDGYNDTNGDGIWGPNESGYVTHTTICNPCEV